VPDEDLREPPYLVSSRLGPIIGDGVVEEESGVVRIDADGERPGANGPVAGCGAQVRVHVGFEGCEHERVLLDWSEERVP
jgi:hypothetical protein